jgi:nicotinic acid mononucleotide adenylyltransferase
MPLPSRPIVITFGRFNPPTTGHKLLFDHVVATAHRFGADVMVYPSVSQDARSNPLPFSTKVKFLQRLFPRLTFNTNPQMRSPFDAFKDVASRGYNKLYVVVGGDRVEAFEGFASYFKRVDARGYDASKHIPMEYHVVGVPRRDIKTVSGTAQRQRAAQNDFAGFLRGSADPKQQDVIRDLFVAVRRGMNMHESHKLRLATLQHSFQMPLVEQLNEGGATGGWGEIPQHGASGYKSLAFPSTNAPFPSHGQQRATFATPSDRLAGAKILYKTLTQQNVPSGLHTPEDIVNDAIRRVLTMPTVRLTTNQWNIAGQMFRKMDELGIQWNRKLLSPMTKRALRLEAEGSGAPKPPSEVDRLKVRQNQEKIELQRRQGNELMAAKLRDVQQKAREQQQKASAPKPASR